MGTSNSETARGRAAQTWGFPSKDRRRAEAAGPLCNSAGEGTSGKLRPSEATRAPFAPPSQRPAKEPRPSAHLQLLRVHGCPEAGPRGYGTYYRRNPAEDRNPKVPDSRNPLAPQDLAAGAGRGGRGGAGRGGAGRGFAPIGCRREGRAWVAGARCG
ncbi:hypothetical protein P7K49_014038 [Saguinus oedipus]|uniref:Uncharacterized protein n=1 Tax=Saguinus oedipus TaxID=9490 RepID=A0ABQ9VHM7_SAGOE|nr:hypothetical protein P7K49_014038 [Saguinus oedipus]